MARTKQTARKSSGGKAPRMQLAAQNASAFRSFMTGRQQVSHGPTRKAAPKKKSAMVGRRAARPGSGGQTQAAQQNDQVTSYLNYENMFYSYTFPTGKRTDAIFEPRFAAGTLQNPVTAGQEHWLGMSLNSMYDGVGMAKHGRPNVNLVVVLDISGSMGSGMGNEQFSFGAYGGESKLNAAKKCLHAIVDQLQAKDGFGLVVFNHNANVLYKLQSFKKIRKPQLRHDIDRLTPCGMTDLSKAATEAVQLFKQAGELSGGEATNRMLYLTDLNSTVNSANDEANLLKILKTEAANNIYTSVVGIGMDFNVKLVEQVSKTRGARYLSVDSSDEFVNLMKKEFSYDVTVIAFNVKVSVSSNDVNWVKGHGSPEINDLKKGKPAVLSSEFPCIQDDKGCSKGGMMVFKLEPKGAAKKMPSSVKIAVEWEDRCGIGHSKNFTVDIVDDQNVRADVDAGLRKAVAIIHFVDLVNDYVMDQRKHKMKFLELFQGFRPHFVSEMRKTGDTTLTTTNQGDLELLDKIISLETPGKKGNQAPGNAPPADNPDGCLSSSSVFSPFQGIGRRVSQAMASVRNTLTGSRVGSATASRPAPKRAPPAKPSGKTAKGAAAKVTFKVQSPASKTPKKSTVAMKGTPAPAATRVSKRTTAKKTAPVAARKAAGQRRPAAKPKPKPKATAKTTATAAAKPATVAKPAAAPPSKTPARAVRGKAATPPAKPKPTAATPAKTRRAAVATRAPAAATSKAATKSKRLTKTKAKVQPAPSTQRRQPATRSTRSKTAKK